MMNLKTADCGKKMNQTDKIRERPIEKEARCPKCGTWSPVTDTIPTFCYAMWEWTENHGANCPRCGYVTMFESECEFR